MIALLVPSITLSQGVGRIVGRVIDIEQGTGLPGVTVQVVGTTLGTVTGVDGRYTLGGIRAGTVTLHARRLGFQAKTVTGLMLSDGQTLEQNISIAEASVQLTATVVTADAERGSVSSALDAQKRAMGVVNAITAEQIQRSPDSDAAQAVQRVSGVTVQDGKYVFVRGLGERYTTTSLNGARIPSPEPERKVVPLDLFPSALLQSVTTTKNFTPDLPGDFSGASVNIRTREFPASRQLAYSLSSGFNDAVTGRTLVAAPSLGLEWLGFAGGDRGLPTAISAVGGLDQPLPQPQVRRLVGAFRNAWSARQGNATPNASFGASAGGSASFLGRQLGYVTSLSYAWSQEARLDERRAYADATGGTREIDRFDGSTGRASVLWGGLLNLSTMLGNRTRFSLNNTYNRTADNEARRESGISENLGQRLLVDRLRFVERSVFSSQLVAQHQLTATHRFDWALTVSGVERNEPDRSEFVRVDQQGAAPFWLDASEAAVRTFGALTERSYAARGDYTWQLGETQRHELKIGGLGRFTDRDASNQVFSIQAPDMSLEARRRAPEEIFADVDLASATFRVVPLAQGGSYSALDAVSAGYVMFKFRLASRADLVGGTRVEHSEMEIRAEPTVGRAVITRPKYTDLLPSLMLNVRLTENQNLRIGGSQTLARPEYRELAEVQYRDVIGAENVLGNPRLERTLIQNADLRWEWYPDRDEVLSIGLFAKRFQDPIERIFLGTSGTRIVTFVNAECADNVGVELELRKKLGFVANALAPLSVFANATVMRSQIQIDESTRAAPESRAMVGQAPYVVNAGLTYATLRSSATLLFNRVGRRIVSASERPLPSVEEEARDVIDFSLRFPLLGGMSGKFDAKNLADSPYVQTQGPVTREFYRAGRTFSLGLSFQP